MAKARQIDSFRIGAFRGLKGVELDRLAAFNLILGGNNSGKTTVLEALGVFAAPLDLVEWSVVGRMREARTNLLSDSLSSIEAVRWLFPQHQINGHSEIGPLQLSASNSPNIFELDAACFPIRGISPEPRKYSRNRPEVEGEEDGWHISVRAVPASLPDRPDLLFDGAGFHFETDLWPSTGFVQRARRPQYRLNSVALGPYSHRNQPLLLRALSRSIEGGAKTSVVALLQEIDPAVRDLEIVSNSVNRPSLLVAYGDAGLLPASVMGDGFRRALSIALGVFEARDGFLLIDEIETAFHVSVLDRVFPWLVRTAANLNVQVFATTHSLEAIQAIANTIQPIGDEIAAYHLDGSAGQSRIIKRYSADMLVRLVRDRGLDIR